MIRLEAIDEHTIEVRPEVRLGDSWGPYQAAIKAAGARNRKTDGVWQTTAPIENASEIEAAVRHLGLPVSIGPGLAACRDQDTSVPLYPFQQIGAKFLASRRAALLLDAPGVGKTSQALSALVRIGRPPTLVVCPANVRAVWKREAGRFAPSMKVSVHGPGLLDRWPRPAELLVISYESLPPTAAEVAVGHALVGLFTWFRLLLDLPTLNIDSAFGLGPAPSGMTFVGDELQYLKERGARRTRRWMAAASRATRWWGLTGTPLLKHPVDLWNVLDAVGLAWSTFGTWERFVEVCGGRVEVLRFGFKVVRRIVWDGPVSPSASEALKQHTLRRLRSDVLPELPEKTVEVLTEDRMGVRLRKRLDEVWEVLEAETGQRRGEDPSAWMPTLDGMAEARAAMALAKLPLVVEMIKELEDAGERVVVWSAHVAVLEKLGQRPGWASLTGDDDFDERTSRVEAFQAGELVGLACSIRAAGVGITLTASSRSIFVDRDWQAAANEQAEDRQVRIGQKNAVLVTIVELDHPLDKRVSEVCGRKSRTAAAVLGDGR